MQIKVNQPPDVAEKIVKKIKDNGGYCPCKLRKTDDTKCLCKAFKECLPPCICPCGLYKKEA